MAKPALRIVSPTNVKRADTPRRPANSELRTREHLTPAEVEQLIEAVRKNFYGHRDATMVLLAYRHGLRASFVTGNHRCCDPSNQPMARWGESKAKGEAEQT
jgi:site-specific recombinase XerC